MCSHDLTPHTPHTSHHTHLTLLHTTSPHSLHTRASHPSLHTPRVCLTLQNSLTTPHTSYAAHITRVSHHLHHMYHTHLTQHTHLQHTLHTLHIHTHTVLVSRKWSGLPGLCGAGAEQAPFSQGKALSLCPWASMGEREAGAQLRDTQTSASCGCSDGPAVLSATHLGEVTSASYSPAPLFLLPSTPPGLVSEAMDELRGPWPLCWSCHPHLHAMDSGL